MIHVLSVRQRARKALNHGSRAGLGHTLCSPNPQTSLGTVGTYTLERGTAVPVSGRLSNSNPPEIWFNVFFGGDTQSFHGFLHSHEVGILAGTTNRHGAPFAFVARRVGSVEEHPVSVGGTCRCLPPP